MSSPLDFLTHGFARTGDVRSDSVAFLTGHGFAHTAGHSARVAAEARRVAQRWQADPARAETAGWLHDISAVIPNEQRIAVAEQLDIDVLPEERSYPMIIHQKLSAAIARDVFGVTDAAVLIAIGCHTTLKPDASALDKVVFVADKVKWDQAGEPPYLDALVAALDQSLDHAALCYLRYLWDRRDSLRVVHPWMVRAYAQLSARLAGDDE